jgi:phosphoribosylanthranilate isomerase
LTVRVKICGLTRVEDALAAVELGADALGFVFAPSPRRVSPEQARAIIRELPPLVQTVGVFVDEDPERVEYTARYCDLDLLQFHGGESPAYCRGFGRRAIKALRLRSRRELPGVSEYAGAAGALLLDTLVPGQQGGTGRTFDWDLALEAARYGRIIVAGGLNPENVAAAISAAKPYGVDASSGLEREPGIKDHGKMARFIERAREAART